MNLAELQTRLDVLEPLSLGYFPTPLDPLPRLSQALGGPALWVKRDDQTGLATGGNKVRKLAFLLAEAQRLNADVVLTPGAQQSNHARQTAAAAARLGLECVLVLRGAQPEAAQGNYLLDQLLGAEVRWAGDGSVPALLEETAATLKAQGRRPYVIPYGGSNALGVCGYVAAFAELCQQMAERALNFDTIVVASSSGGTQAGLALGARMLGYRGRILGIAISDPAEAFRARVAGLANDAAALLGLDERLTPTDIYVDDTCLGSGYGVVSDLEREAITLAARTEGLLVDPVYTGRALGGLMRLVRQSAFAPDDSVLFWHTGGAAALFAYAATLTA